MCLERPAWPRSPGAPPLHRDKGSSAADAVARATLTRKHTMKNAHAHAFGLALLCMLGGEIGAGASLHCAMRREISPCTCRREDTSTGLVQVTCQRISNYAEVVNALSNKFTPETKISLEIAHSDLPDINAHSFRQLGLSITKLKLNYDNISDLKETAFVKMDLLVLLYLADNSLETVPRGVLRHLPHIGTLDLSRNQITEITEHDFQDIQALENLVVAGNQITKIETHALPKGIKHVHLGHNNLNSLNGALRDLVELEWIFINNNNLKSLDNELPVAKRINLIHAAHNELQSLPNNLKLLPLLSSLYLYYNKLVSLDGALKKCRKLKLLGLSCNNIETLSEDEFAEDEELADLDLAYNQLKSLNGSLRSLKSLRYLNLTHNQFTEFSLQEIKGLRRLSVIDLSHNKIKHLTGHMENLVDVETRVLELRLDHNDLHTIGGALMGLHGLLRLNLSHNHIQEISPDDFIGLDELRLLDISHNQITTLEETSKTFLPVLEDLLAHHNNITMLYKDFHGLPSLCTADLSFNQIQTVDYGLVSKTRCMVNNVPSMLKIYLQDNPVMCDEHVYELMSVMEGFNARIVGSSKCAPAPDSAPVLMRALNDIMPQKESSPMLVLARIGGGVRVVPLDSDSSQAQYSFRRVGGLIGHVLPEREGGLPVVVEPPVTLPPPTTSGVKWPLNTPPPPPPHPFADLRQHAAP